ncbi:TetR/AcrR family transcriptional regulator [Kribbella sindirgiensis]|uniref:TetR/AcrR family transcriptional regulator n=1 Tax=Kribbella sindirgiensis TaxID=1124744 RepID=A0A4R0IFS4_9ACTN|nr:TetR/AcrR family transcriptional regulator [Kribbella sindirgiensis]TCC31387.1 TetR/AcrR family transcriptional regulator [Kribbella sindirgiensis]
MPRTAARGGPQTRARISDVATQLFLERGFDAVTVAEVAREAGVSSVTVFKHFPRKEDLLLDRADDAIDLLRTAVRSGAADVLTSLREAVLGLADDRHALSGLKDGSIPFFVTVAASPALIARAREIADEIQQTLVEELAAADAFDGDAALLAAFLISGYTAVLTGTARRLMAGETPDEVAEDQRARVDHLFDKLRNGFAG